MYINYKLEILVLYITTLFVNNIMCLLDQLAWRKEASLQHSAKWGNKIKTLDNLGCPYTMC